MIHDLDETLKQILVQKGKLSLGDIDIVFDQPTGEWAATLNRPTVNFYLYDIRENLELRNTSQIVTERNVNGGTGRRIHPPRRIDLSYLITVWARNPEDEHQLLWRILQTFMQLAGVIKLDLAVGLVREQPLDLPLRVALPSEAMRNLSDLWGVMENQLKPSINLVITAALDTQKAIEAPLVFTSIVRYGQGTPLTQVLIAEDVQMYHIGGRVLVKGYPVGAGAQVTLLSRGDRVQTDSDGAFVFAYMQPGDYDIEVAIEGRQPKVFNIVVPARSYDLSL
jgi:hypothetical protein